MKTQLEEKNVRSTSQCADFSSALPRSQPPSLAVLGMGINRLVNKERVPGRAGLTVAVSPNEDAITVEYF